ncbi:hypothetical protein CO731_02497 [Aminobacter sp. MSH1]|uniref:hypothetical protein n=1 Tax=Aminobacter sp. MSH1 TaxID=374606 RepID=UPI000D505440|nr:hypothetical protein [Aminobacter sp. MSH1]AWC23029.1 hypothetical protein CO731_02497 [Aminobacter sp. MSH1]
MPLNLDKILRKARGIRPFGDVYFKRLYRKIERSEFIFIHSITNNIGDLMSCPVRYFDRFTAHNSIELSSKEILEVSKFGGSEFLLKLLEGKIVCFGGGGLIGLDRHDVHDKVIEFLTMFADRGGDVVVWGAGHNRTVGFREWLDGVGSSPYPSSFEKFRLVGLRDYPNPYDWVPCVSCLHPVFDEKIPSQYECVAFLHGHESSQFGDEFSNVPNIYNISKGSKDNSESYFLKCINIIGSGDNVVTNSYHGLYWATLLGKKVIAIQNSSKFLDFRYKYENCLDFKDWRKHVGKGNLHQSALMDCRSANTEFLKKFELLMN